MERARRAALHNLGCKVNAYETEAMRQQLQDAGYEIVPFAPGADVYVINTCSVTNIADRKSRQMLSRARKMNPGAVVVAVGCYVQTAAEKTHLAVEADIILGNNRKSELVSALADYFRTEAVSRAAPSSQITANSQITSSSRAVRSEMGQERISKIGHARAYEEMRLSRNESHTRALLKVQDGCNQFCSYCIIPYARGRVRSRAAADVLREVRDLALAGTREIVLTGIHLSSYGSDFPGEETDLLRLIRDVSCVEGVERIRLGSLEPGIVTERFARELAQIPQVCPHFHLSLQSGCDTVLRRMNRRYTTGEFLERCQILRGIFRDPALTTDVIVGFPGETQEEFARTEEFLRKICLYETHIFKYSRREGTRAAAMEGQIPESVKAQRSAALIRLGDKNRRGFERRWMGKPCEVLFEERQTLKGEEYFVGHTREYIRAAIPAELGRENQTLTGTLREALELGEEHLLLFTPCK